MSGKGRGSYQLIVCLTVIALSGCAPVAPKVNLLYSPLFAYRGGSGALELADGPSLRKGDANHWVLGKIKDSEGFYSGEVISDFPPDEVITNALKHELAAAGYQVSQAEFLSNAPEKGVLLKKITVQLDEIPSLFKLESSCAISVEVVLWKQGHVVKNVEYRTSVSEAAVLDRDDLPKALFQKAIRRIIAQVVPDIIAELR